MEDRTVIEWDKDDLDALGILKIDVLALGMLTCIRKAFDLIEGHNGGPMDAGRNPAGGSRRSTTCCRKADSIGVFQVESRAQMSMLPRLKPSGLLRSSDRGRDRPAGADTGRYGPPLSAPPQRHRRPIDCPPKRCGAVSEKTKGVPLFQEQAMRIAIVGAGFTADEADKLRRSMASFSRNGDIEKFRDKFINGMIANGYEPDFATRCLARSRGSALRLPRKPRRELFAAGLCLGLDQVLPPRRLRLRAAQRAADGVLRPAQIVRDAREHGVAVLPVDVNHSDWDCTLEPVEETPSESSRAHWGRGRGPEREGEVGMLQRLESHLIPAFSRPAHIQGGGEGDGPRLALRLGFRQIKGFSRPMPRVSSRRAARDIRMSKLYGGSSGLGRLALERLAAADALRSLDCKRRSTAARRCGR